MTSVSITAASDLKREGNAFYAQGKAVDAILKYKEALGLLLGAKDGDVTSPTAMLENAGEAYAYDRKTVTSNVAAAPDSKNNNNTNNTNKADPNAKDIAILFSNASQALLDLKRNEAAAASAAAAVSHDPTLLKAWVRRVRALLAMASRFEAFIVFYIHIAPIVRNAQTTAELAEIEAIIGDLQDKVSQSVGVTNVNPGLGLRLTHHEAPKNADGTPSSSEASAKKADGGLSTVAIRPIVAETVIFMEKQFAHDKLDAAAPKETLNDLSSEELVKHFSAQLVKCVRSKKAGEAELLWTQFASTMRGSWPRNLNEISVSLADHFITELRAFHKKDIAEGYIVDEDAPSSDEKPTNADDDDGGFGQVSSNKKKKAIAFSVTLRELTHLAVACRYNCFHSGFFRACALANHGCNPNAAMKYVESEKKVVLVAVRDIAVGEDITVKYLLDFEYVMGVSRRRELSHRSWLFWCNCGRCEKDLFDKDAAQCEWVRCRSCNDPVKGYAHLPNKGLYGGASDPSVPDFGICRGCGEEVRLSKEDTVTALQTVQTLYATFSQPQVPLQVMGESLVNAWRTAHPLVHEEHWTHRVQLYCYCLPLSEFITNIFNMLASRQLKPEDCTDFLYSFGLCKPYEEGGCGLSTPSAAAGGGGDILVALLELWRRIEPFYPPAQAWQLHLMIIKLLVINLLQPEYTCTMDCDLAAEILSQHTPFIGANERSAHARIMMNRKDLNKDIKWTPKATKLIKKAFS